MEQENILIDNNEIEDSALTKVQNGKFRNLSKEFFQYDISKEVDPLKTIKDYSRFFSFHLPYEISDFFIRMDEAPLFWIMRSPLIQQIENVYKALTQTTGASSYKSIKEFYTKWIVIKHDEEKKYFATSALNLTDRKTTGRGIFPLLILQAVLLGFDKLLFNPAKSLELLENSKDILGEGKINSNFREDLSYLINIYSSFVYLKQKDFGQARAKLAEAITSKPIGITARFYDVLIDMQETQGIMSPDFISELYNYDLSRIDYAMDSNNSAMFEYFVKFPVTVNLFYHNEFAPSADIVADFFKSVILSVETDMRSIRTRLNELKDLNMNEHYTPKIIQDIEFLEKVIPQFIDSKSLMLTGTLPKLLEKLNKIAEGIIEVIRQKNFSVVKERLLVFDKGMQEKYNEMQVATKNYEEQKVKLKENLDQNLEVVEKRAADNIAVMEERIKNLQYIQSLNPRSTFRNAMTYNFILSFTVFLLGGCAGYSNSALDDPGKMNSILTIIIVSGFKWGIIAFLVGLIISFVAAGLAMLEGTNQKQRLLQAINAIKNEKEYHLSYYKKEFERVQKDIEERYTKTQDDFKKQMNDLKNERDKNEKEFKESAEQKVQEESKALRALLAA